MNLASRTGRNPDLQILLAEKSLKLAPDMHQILRFTREIGTIVSRQRDQFGGDGGEAPEESPKS